MGCEDERVAHGWGGAGVVGVNTFRIVDTGRLCQEIVAWCVPFVGREGVHFRDRICSTRVVPNRCCYRCHDPVTVMQSSTVKLSMFHKLHRDNLLAVFKSLYVAEGFATFRHLNNSYATLWDYKIWICRLWRF